MGCLFGANWIWWVPCNTFIRDIDWNSLIMTKYSLTKNHGYHIANQVFLMGNIAIAMSYFSVGFTTSFMATPLNIYLVHTLNAEPPMQT